MRLELQNSVLELIGSVTGGVIDANSKTPDWLNRPGKAECGTRWSLICQIYFDLTGLKLPEQMPKNNRRRMDGILRLENAPPRIIEIDEVQHFNRFRGATIRRYPNDLKIAFDAEAWIAHWQGDPKQKFGNFVKPAPPLFPNAGGRHLQRAFRDALADILPPDNGFLPTLRIAYFEVKPWLDTAIERTRMRELIDRKTT